MSQGICAHVHKERKAEASSAPLTGLVLSIPFASPGDLKLRVSPSSHEPYQEQEPESKLLTEGPTQSPLSLP